MGGVYGYGEASRQGKREEGKLSSPRARSVAGLTAVALRLAAREPWAGVSPVEVRYFPPQFPLNCFDSIAFEENP